MIMSTLMSKRRKTRREKIILQLKRQVFEGTKFQPSQEAKFPQAEIEIEPKPAIKKPDVAIFSYDPKLIKTDIFKTLILTAIIISLEIVLYLKLG